MAFRYWNRPENMKRQNDRLKEVAYHNANVLVAKKYCIIERERKVEHLEGSFELQRRL